MTSISVNPHPQRAADLVGGQSELARRLSTSENTLTPQAVGDWCRAGRVPPERVLDVVAATNFRVSAHQLRPDLYPADLDRYLSAA